MKKSAAAVLFLLASAAVPAVSTPVTHADVGAHIGVGDNVAGDAAVAAAVAAPEDAAAQAAAGRPPCYTPAGVPYYTPGDLPCN
jgi:hypothetical protein